MENNFQIVFKTYDNVEVHIDRQNDTVWLNKNQMAQLFEIDRSGVSRHIRNIFTQSELDEKSNVQKMHIASSDKPVDFYSLDVVLAVGYRANSGKASAFRRWATDVLKQYLTQGYAINEQKLREKQERLDDLKQALELLTRTITTQAQSLNEAQNLAAVLDAFAGGLDLLDDYDNKSLAENGATNRPAVVIPKSEYLAVIQQMRPEFGSDVFANPKDDSFDSSINQIYQTFGGRDCYPTLEEKAAMLLYFLVKNHGFTDGNKRIGAACFLYFLNKNKMLYNKNGLPVIDNAALFALTLLIAESRPAEKDTMKRIVISVLNKGKPK